ncbi:hypothetical protein R0K04_29725, partial [Pseudoalteromonas sp. SIMBA_153]
REDFVTDYGNVILDTYDLDVSNPIALEKELNTIYFLFITIYYRHYAVVSSQVIYYMSTIHSPSAAKHASSFARTSRQA